VFWVLAAVTLLLGFGTLGFIVWAAVHVHRTGG
jgi:hypothetical protein